MVRAESMVTAVKAGGSQPSAAAALYPGAQDRHRPAAGVRKVEVMSDYKHVLKTIHDCSSPVRAMAELNMPPSKLRRILAGPRLQRQLEMEQMVTQLIVRHRASLVAGAAVFNLAEVSDVRVPRESRKASMALLHHSMQNIPPLPRCDSAGPDTPPLPKQLLPMLKKLLEQTCDQEVSEQEEQVLVTEFVQNLRGLKKSGQKMLESGSSGQNLAESGRICQNQAESGRAETSQDAACQELVENGHPVNT